MYNVLSLIGRCKESFQRMSEDLYVGMCIVIGNPTVVNIRREIKDIQEKINKPAANIHGNTRVESGSYREGFRFTSSDIDNMFWPLKVIMICEPGQFNLYNDDATLDIFLMEYSDTPPGFVRLKVMAPINNDFMTSSVITHLNGIYVSHEKFQNFFLTEMRMSDALNSDQQLRLHGPCANFFFHDIESDLAVCLACPFWPRTAISWFTRCQKKQWPDRKVLNNIRSDGCHVMPIGSVANCCDNKLEWRLSFSKAEQNIIYSLNHTQLLCYGILKIFLKEVLCSKNQESLICSYFLKTILFWEIQNNPDRFFWCPSNLVSCFWVCFKHLCKCVFNSYCPNFFVPENNMFHCKIVGASREALLAELYVYYEMKEKDCLFKSHTIFSTLSDVCRSSLCLKRFSDGHTLSLEDKDKVISYELFKISFRTQKTLFPDCFATLTAIYDLNQIKMSQLQKLTLQYAACCVLEHMAFLLSNVSRININVNKCWYRVDKAIINMLTYSSKIGPVSQLLYLAVYFYKTGRYFKALRIAQICQYRFSQPIIMFEDYVDRQEYTECVKAHSLGTRMKKTWADLIVFDQNINEYLPELLLEHRHCKEKKENIYISPLVFLHMIIVLCNFRVGNRSQCLQSLADLQTLLLSNEETYIDRHTRDISWQILGICQHLVGDHDGALQSYQQSLSEKPYHGLQRVTETRIRDLL